jgi:ribonuclease R
MLSVSHALSGRRPKVAEVDRVNGRLVAVPLLGDSSPLALRPQPKVNVGDIVLVESGATSEPGVVHTTLARTGSFRAALYRLASRHGLDPTYPHEALDEAETAARAPRLGDPDLDDLRHLPFVTIDNQGSRDLDQALYLERRNSDTVILRYAVADASHLVRPGTALFAEALARGATFYLPGMSFPMLPPVLSEGSLSLNPRKLRRSLLFEIELDRHGQCVRTSIRRAVIRSLRKLSYRMVQRYYDDPGGSSLRQAAFSESLDLLREIGEQRIALARHRDVVDYRRSEIEIIPARGRAWVEVHTRERLSVERYNEQISLLCNVEGARLLAEAHNLDHVQPVFRVHPSPTSDQLARLERQIAEIVASHGLDPGRWCWRRRSSRAHHGQSLADYLEGLPQSPSTIRIMRAIDRQALLCNRKSMFDEVPGPHSGVGAPFYARFTAPMREIVGVFTHKEAFEALNGPSSDQRPADDLELQHRVVHSGNRARDLQRRLDKGVVKLVLDHWFEPELDLPAPERPWRAGTVLGMKPGLVYIELDRSLLEIKIHLQDLEEDHRARYVVTGHDTQAAPAEPGKGPILSVGCGVRLRVRSHDPAREHWIFDVRLTDCARNT